MAKGKNMSKRVSLCEAVPDIYKYWDFVGNGYLDPESYSSNSMKDDIYTFCPICGTSLKRKVRNSWVKDADGIGHVLHCRTCGKRNKSNS